MPRPFIFAAVMLAAACATAHADRSIADSPPGEDGEAVVPVVFHRGPTQSYVDLDQFLVTDGESEPVVDSEAWTCQVLPSGLIYESHLAGTKESRLSFTYLKPEDEDGWLIDGNVGGRVGLFRYGNTAVHRPEGFQFDVEGSAQLRLDPQERRDLRSVDFRAGAPLTFGTGRVRWRFGYYHISAHLGDEFLSKNPGYQRLNFSRDALILSRSYYLTPQTRIYGEAGWAFYSDISEPWEFQFGIDHAPHEATGRHGAPFWAVNGHLRQEVDFGGSLTAQAGWAWRSDTGSPLMRAGFHYFNGKSNQYSFYQQHEQQLGMALWYDY